MKNTESKPSVKILVAYHKPAQLIKDDVFVPIHLGRALATQASKDGTMSQDDYQWMLSNMIGDDTGDNISNFNRHFCELTAIYWAWKNYDTLGNPDYIGLEHYRRHFKAEDIDTFANYDITATIENCKNIFQQFKAMHFSDKLDLAFETAIIQNPKLKEILPLFIQNNKSYFFNMFIMKKEIFFEYCSFLFNILIPLHNSIDYSAESLYNQRLPGFLAERLTSLFICAKKQNNYRINPCTAVFSDVPTPEIIRPAFAETSINICFASDDKYAPFLGVAIASIKQNASIDDKYDICIIEDGITPHHKKRLSLLSSSNFSIRFVNVAGHMLDMDKKLFYLNAHPTLATYYRFFIPQVFKNYSRILYLDCDLVANADIATLYKTDLGPNAIGAVLDVEMLRILIRNSYHDGSMLEYLQNCLKMQNPEKYFQAGVLLFDVKKLQEMDFTQQCLNRLQEIKTPKFPDQCVLNSLFTGNVTFLDLPWNVEYHIPIFTENYTAMLPSKILSDYHMSRKSPKIIHYSGAAKPWDFPRYELADIWWHYARQTPFYEEILFRKTLPQQNESDNSVIQKVDASLLKEVLQYKKIRNKYYLYKILSKVTFGKLRKKYKQKRMAYKQRRANVRQFLKNK